MGATVAKLRNPSPGMLFSSGKLDEVGAEIAAAADGEGAELVLIDGPVTPVQQRNLEKHWDVKILDRTGLILEIFADRARTREGVLQVELAALSYQRTRLVRAWTHLERQRGGFGFVGGPGETQIEADRRMIQERMTRIERELETVTRIRYMGETPIIPGTFLRVSARVKGIAGNLPQVRVAGWPGTSARVVVSGVPQSSDAVSLPGYGRVVEVSAIIATATRQGLL